MASFSLGSKYKIGDLTDVGLKNGERIRGYLRKIAKSKIMIDNQEIKIINLDDRSLAHFDPIMRDIKIKEYERGKIAELKEKKSEYSRLVRDEISHQLYVEYGYIFISGE